MVAPSSIGIAAVAELDGDQRRQDLDRAELDVRRDGDLEPAAAAEVHALGGREADSQVGPDLEAVAGQQLGEERVAVVRAGLTTILAPSTANSM